MSRIIVAAAIAVALSAAVSAHAQNTVTFDNQSGEPALVKLIGLTSKEVEVPIGAKQSVDASAGRYTIKVRYGTPGKYRYSKGEEFEVKETATTRSSIIITLHKVVGGNYGSESISEQEFDQPVSPPRGMAPKPETTAGGDRSSNMPGAKTSGAEPDPVQVVYVSASPGLTTGILKKEVDQQLRAAIKKAAIQLGVIPNENYEDNMPPEYLLFEEGEHTLRHEKGGPPFQARLVRKLGKTLGPNMDQAADALLGQRVTVTVSSDGKVERIERAKTPESESQKNPAKQGK